jgi:sec-independent protein translocase protein TatB
VLYCDIEKSAGEWFVFGMSMWELGLIVLVALILLGPRQLADVARVAGKMYGEIMRLAREARDSIDLDTMTSTTTHHETPGSQPQATGSENEDMHLGIEPSGKSGPDFYAELLEKSKEEDEGEQTGVRDAPAGHTSDSVNDGTAEAGHREKQT